MIAIHVVFFPNFYMWIFNGIFIGPKLSYGVVIHYPLFCYFWIHIIFTPLLFHVRLCSYWNFIFSHFSLSTLDLGMAMLWLKYVFNKK